MFRQVKALRKMRINKLNSKLSDDCPFICFYRDEEVDFAVGINKG